MSKVSLIIDNPNIDNSKTRVIALPRCKLVQRGILDSAFKTHENLSNDDRSFILGEIIRMNLDNQDLVNFVLQIYKLSNTGRFSLTYNMDLDNHIKVKDIKRIKKLINVSGKEKAWPELYNNPYLTVDEITSIKSMYNREFYAILNTLENASSANDFDNIIPCVINKDDTIALNKEGIQYTSIYSKCYDNVCISESGQSGKIVSLSNNEIPQIAYVADGKNERYCFKMMELVKQLSNGDYINSQSGKMFSELALSQMILKYEKEIKMHKRHMDILRKAGL